MPLAPPPRPWASSRLLRLASRLPSETAGLGNVTSWDRSQTGPVPSVLVIQAGREGCRYVSRPRSPPWGESSLPIAVSRPWDPRRFSEGFVSHPGVLPSPRQDLQPSKSCRLEPSGETGAESALPSPSVPAGGGGELDAACGRHGFESGKHTYQQTAER